MQPLSCDPIVHPRPASRSSAPPAHGGALTGASAAKVVLLKEQVAVGKALALVHFLQPVLACLRCRKRY